MISSSALALLIVSIILIVIAIVQVESREWRYKNFRCPRCKHYNGKRCDKFRNWQEQCHRFIKRK